MSFPFCRLVSRTRLLAWCHVLARSRTFQKSVWFRCLCGCPVLVGGWVFCSSWSSRLQRNLCFFVEMRSVSENSNNQPEPRLVARSLGIFSTTLSQQKTIKKGSDHTRTVHMTRRCCFPSLFCCRPPRPRAIFGLRPLPTPPPHLFLV